MAEETQSQIQGKKGNPVAILSYIGILFIIPLLAAKDDEFVKFHVKQGITLFIAEVITSFIWVIPILGWVVGFGAGIFWFILFILGVINVLKGEKKPLPLIGKFGERFKF